MELTTWALLCLLHCIAQGAKPNPTTPTTTMDPIDAQISDMKQTTEGLSRQMVMQQLFVEERVRSDGDSGIKQKPMSQRGTKSYLSDTVSPYLAGRRDHDTFSRDMEIGQNVFVLNGVEFRIFHQIYRLKMPSKTSKEWHKTEDIPFPDVPHSVLAKHNISEQILEMKEYFRAFKNQDPKIRSDYARYFKPVMCYLEGTWIDGVSHNPNRWFSGAMGLETLVTDGLEDNNAFYPTKIMSVVNGTASYAHWDSRILCHPIKQELKLASFYVKDDLAARLASNKSLYDFSKTHDARFDLAERPSGKYFPDVGYGPTGPRFDHYTKLDSIMEEIPGMDNYPAHITGGAFGLTAYNARFPANNTELNIGRYHHWYKVNQKGAMGTKVINRGYADRTLWVAMNNQPKVAPMSYTTCVKDRHTHKNNCTKDIVRYSYALPLEIVWMTPLLSWNPYNIPYYSGDYRKSPANSINAHGHNGHDEAHAMYGANERNFYLTPREFFGTYYGRRFVKDRQGKVHQVVPSGIQTILRDIPSVGNVRLRYPIMPKHQDGNTVYKELDALKDLVMKMAVNAQYFHKKPAAIHSTGNQVAREEHYTTSSTTKTPPGGHVHDIYLTTDDIAALENGTALTVYTSLNNGHQHALEIYADKNIHYRYGHYRISLCDGKTECWDGHSNILYYYY